MIICLHKLKRDDAAIAKEVACDVRSVRHWISHYEEHSNVDDLPRSGRKRKTTAEQDAAIVAEAKATKFTTPRRMYIFNENMDAKKLQHILGTHLIESAELHFDIEHAERWWFLQDNAPQHKSVLVRTWLFNNGIQCIDFPPYSPDLNPIENLWADLARRVEEF